jgi:acyl carrier protein
MNEVKDRIKKFIIDNFLFGEAESLKDEISLLEEGIIDSTGVLELVTYIEEEYSISVDDEELVPENLDSINNVTAYIGRKCLEEPVAA